MREGGGGELGNGGNKMRKVTAPMTESSDRIIFNWIFIRNIGGRVGTKKRNQQGKVVLRGS